MEIFSALLATCAGISPVTGEFPAQRPVTRSFDAFFDLRLNKWLSKQWWCWWFETPSRPLWRHFNGHKSELFLATTGCYALTTMMVKSLKRRFQYRSNKSNIVVIDCIPSYISFLWKIRIVPMSKFIRIYLAQLNINRIFGRPVTHSNYRYVQIHAPG